MKNSYVTSVKGRFLHAIYSPRGEIEGALIQVDGAAAQVVFDKDDESGPALFQGLKGGQLLELAVAASPLSPKGKGAHKVLDFRELVSVDGKAPAEPLASNDDLYRGRVVRFNYARPGAINGVVLDTGDFLHLKPDGYDRLGLQIGDSVEADGEAQQLADGLGWAVEATEVNGRPVAKR